MFLPKTNLGGYLHLGPRRLPSLLPTDGEYLTALPFLVRTQIHPRSDLLHALELARCSPAIRISRFALTCPRIVPSQCCVSQPWRNLRWLSQSRFSNFFYLFVNERSISRLCTSYQIHFRFTGSLIKEFQSTGSPSTKSFLYSKYISISLMNLFRSFHERHVGIWLSPIQGPVQHPRPRFGNQKLTFFMFFIFRIHSQLFIPLVPFIAEFGQLLQNSKILPSKFIFHLRVTF